MFIHLQRTLFVPTPGMGYSLKTCRWPLVFPGSLSPFGVLNFHFMLAKSRAVATWLIFAPLVRRGRGFFGPRGCF